MIIFGRARYADLAHLARVKGWTVAEAAREVAVANAGKPKRPAAPAPSAEDLREIAKLMHHHFYTREEATAIVCPPPAPRVKMKGPR